MANEGDFTLISVSSDEDDDVVIQAGVREADQISDDTCEEPMEDGGAESETDSGSDSDPDAGAADDSADALEAAVALDPEALRVKQRLDEAGLTVEDLDEEARAEYARHMARSHARAQAEKMLTTEEDLHTKMPFSGMQRGIVVLLLLLVVAFVVYWAVAR